jgi:hypothetical protein
VQDGEGIGHYNSCPEQGGLSVARPIGFFSKCCLTSGLPTNHPESLRPHLLREHILILPTENGNCRVVPRAPDSQRRRVFLDGLFRTKST